jgi:hypothetical protein
MLVVMRLQVAQALNYVYQWKAFSMLEVISAEYTLLMVTRSCRAVRS